MRTRFSHCIVYIAVVQHRTVIAAENHNCLLSQVQTVQSPHYGAYRSVEFQYRIATPALSALALKARVRHTRHVYVIRRQIQKERRILMPANKATRLTHKVVSDILILPQGRNPTTLIANATDAIHYRHIMPVRVAYTQQLRVLLARRQIAYLVLVVHLQRVIRAKIQHPTVAQIHTRHAVRGRWHNKALVKANIIRRMRDRLIPIDTAPIA